MLSPTSLKNKHLFPNMYEHALTIQKKIFFSIFSFISSPVFTTTFLFPSLPVPWGEDRDREHTFCYRFLILLTLTYFSHQVRVYISSSHPLSMSKCTYLLWPPSISDSAISCFQNYLYHQVLKFLRV